MQANKKRITENKLNEECAVFGVSLTTDEAVGVTYNGLLSLQHRGQEGAGIAVADNRSIVCRKGMGLVSEVFPGKKLIKLPKGRVAVGHTRYSTTGGNSKQNAGPFITEYLTGRIATSHNGNITNAREIREELKGYGLHFTATSDSEVVSSLIAYCIMQEKSAILGIIRAADRLRGAFSIVMASSKNKLIAVRDPNGFRPLCIGKNTTGLAVSSESCALDACGFEFVRDVKPGEVITIENGEITHQEIKLENKEPNRGLCIFEYVYFARPDSVIDGLSVYIARYNMGLALAQEYPVTADVVCGVPDSGLDAAFGYSAQSGIPLVTGFVKSRYIGRSFIYPTQSQRDSAVRLKLNPLKASISGKRIVLVDDSIVRGTTSEKIVKSLKNAGAKEVHVRISSPPFRHTCHYGTDIDSEENLIANKMSIDEICRKIGADSLGYISIEGLKTACKQCAIPFCTACFDGNTASRARKNVLE
uniref:Amidophosphoribosyltransferase n=1 Tax=uncultured bacterium contig00003 TaxID=1181495 RepID=A0A806KN67_9BACT|nr:amidophosphoribosyltransferase [uncultured bacterium contig00003]